MQRMLTSQQRVVTKKQILVKTAIVLSVLSDAHYSIMIGLECFVLCDLRPIDSLGYLEPNGCGSRETRGSTEKRARKNGNQRIG